MSIDLDIFPTNSKCFSCGELKTRFLDLLTPKDIDRIGTLSLIELGSNKLITDNEKIYFSSDENFQAYFLSLNIPNTIGINISKNKPNDLNEFDYLEDYGRNLDESTIKILAKKWQLIGYSYGLTTLAGRSKYEPPLFIALATAIAYLCNGYVIVMSDEFTLDVGVYTPEEFQKAKMNFSKY